MLLITCTYIPCKTSTISWDRRQRSVADVHGVFLIVAAHDLHNSYTPPLVSQYGLWLDKRRDQGRANYTDLLAMLPDPRVARPRVLLTKVRGEMPTGLLAAYGSYNDTYRKENLESWLRTNPILKVG